MGFVNTIQSFAGLVVWLWTVALPQPVAAFITFAVLLALFVGLFRLLWGLI